MVYPDVEVGSGEMCMDSVRRDRKVKVRSAEHLEGLGRTSARDHGDS